MPEFLNLLPPSEAMNIWMSNIQVMTVSEEIDTVSSLGRITSSSILAPYPLPPFSRSSVDGFALIAADTFGVSDSLPAYLKITGEVTMGSEPRIVLQTGQAVVIHTGGMLPAGANAVVMVEHTQMISPEELEVLRPVSHGENILRTGEDVRQGEEIIPAGVVLRPQEIGGLMALGLTRVQVVRKPRIGIISTGDEVIPPEASLLPGQVRDINSYSLSAQVEEAGGRAHRYGIVPDEESALRKIVELALKENEIIVITAGSSASVRDLTSQVINNIGKPGVLVHGVNVRPGKPTILAACYDTLAGINKAIIGLPGNPVSALVIARLFLVPLIHRWLQLNRSTFHNQMKAQLTINLASQAGREDWVPVRINFKDGSPEVEPIFGKSNLIFGLVRADGLLRIPPDATGLSAGEVVDVIVF
jgi:molybdopterin molybdotransferase